SQLSGPIAGFLTCVEDAQRLRLPSAPSPRRGPTGLHRTRFPDFTKIQKADFSTFSIFVLSVASTKLRDKRYTYLIVDCEEKAYYLSSNTQKVFSHGKSDIR